MSWNGYQWQPRPRPRPQFPQQFPQQIVVPMGQQQSVQDPASQMKSFIDSAVTFSQMATVGQTLAKNTSNSSTLQGNDTQKDGLTLLTQAINGGNTSEKSANKKANKAMKKLARLLGSDSEEEDDEKEKEKSKVSTPTKKLKEQVARLEGIVEGNTKSIKNLEENQGKVVSTLDTLAKSMNRVESLLEGSQSSPAKLHSRPQSLNAGAVADADLDNLEVSLDMFKNLCRELGMEEKLFDNSPLKGLWDANAEAEVGLPEFLKAFQQAKPLAFFKTAAKAIGVDPQTADSATTKKKVLVAALSLLNADFRKPS